MTPLHVWEFVTEAVAADGSSPETVDHEDLTERYVEGFASQGVGR